MSLLENSVTLSAVIGDAKYLSDTIKAIEFSSKNILFKNIQLLSSVSFEHKKIKYIPINPLNYIQYSYFMIKEYNKYINTDFVLHIQYDGFIINPSSWTDDFLNYDYIGALWPVGLHEPKVTENNRCGNGGFSLRSKKFLEICEKHCPYIPYINEDAIVCRIYRSMFLENGAKYATDDMAVKFSIEDDSIPEVHNQNHNDRYSLKSFGFHQKNSDAINFLKSH